MTNRTKIISTAISDSEYEDLRLMAYQKDKTMSTLVHDILRGVEPTLSFLPDVSKKNGRFRQRKSRSGAP